MLQQGKGWGYGAEAQALVQALVCVARKAGGMQQDWKPQGIQEIGAGEGGIALTPSWQWDKGRCCCLQVWGGGKFLGQELVDSFVTVLSFSPV